MINDVYIWFSRNTFANGATNTPEATFKPESVIRYVDGCSNQPNKFIET